MIVASPRRCVLRVICQPALRPRTGNLHRRVDSKGARGSAAVGTPIALAIQRGGCRGHGRASAWTVSMISAFSMPCRKMRWCRGWLGQLALDDVEGDAFVGQLDGVTRWSGCACSTSAVRATTCRWCRTADRSASPHERDPRAAGARSSGRRCRPRGACRACRGGSRNGGRSRRSPRRSLVRSSLRNGWRKSALRGEAADPRVVVCLKIARSLGLTLSLPLARPR